MPDSLDTNKTTHLLAPVSPSARMDYNSEDDRGEEYKLGFSIENITKLSCKEDWASWYPQFDDYLVAFGYKYLLTTDKTEPTLRDGETDGDFKKRKMKWRLDQYKAVHTLGQTLASNAEKNIRYKDHNLAACMEELELSYKPNKHDIKDLFRDYYGLSLDDCDSVLDLYLRLNTIRNAIQVVDKTSKIADPHHTLRFLDALGQKYFDFAIDFEYKNNIFPERDPKHPETIIKPAVDILQALKEAKRVEGALRTVDNRQKEIDRLVQQVQGGGRRRRRRGGSGRSRRQRQGQSQ